MRTLKRDQEIIRELEAGTATQVVAQRFGISKGRVSQIKREYLIGGDEIDRYALMSGLTQISPFKELGSSGLKRYGGRVDEEFLRELRGDSGRKIFREMRENHPVINAIFFAIEMSLRQVKWNSEPPSDGNTEASDFLDQCLDDMSFTWQDTLSQVLTMLQYGFSIFELVYKMRRGRGADPESVHEDGRIGWRKWLPISQDTLTPGDEWVFDESGGIQAVNQTDPASYRTATIPIEKALLFRTTVAKNNPEGRSLLRGQYVPWYYSKNFQEIEGIAAERMGCGIPAVYLGSDTKKSGSESDLEWAKQVARDIRVDEQMGVVIPYAKMGGGAAEGKGVLFELISPPSRGLVDFSEAIGRYNKQIAMVGLAQFIMLGMEQVGSYALSKNHSDLFILALSSWAESIAQTVNRYAVPRLFDLNPGFAGELPQLTHSEVAVPDLQEMAAYVNALVGAQVLTPDPGLERRLREIAKLPEKEEPVVIEDVEPEIAAEETEEVGTPAGLPEPELASEKFQIQGRRAVGGARYETATNVYQAELEAIYTNWYERLARKLVGEVAEDKREAVLLSALNELEGSLKVAGRKGIMDAMMLGSGGNPLSPQGYAKLADMVAQNDVFVENSLISAIREKARLGLREPELMLGGEEAVSGVFATFRGRVASYAGGYWTAIFEGVGDQVLQESDPDDRKVEVVLDPNAQHCTTCPKLAGVYENWADMLARSGIPATLGRAECSANCRCYLKIESSPGSGVFERMSDLLDAETFAEEEGRWVTVNGQHLLIGDVPEGYEKPAWASDDGVEIQGEIVHKGKFALTKNKYSVNDGGSPSSWADSPIEAIQSYRKLIEESRQKSAEWQKRQGELKRVKSAMDSGKVGDEDVRLFASGKKLISKKDAVGTLREMGLRWKEATQTLKALRPSMINADAIPFYEPREILTKARDLARKD